MIVLGAFYLTVEFYIIAAVIAAAIVGFVAMGKSPAPVKKFSLSAATMPQEPGPSGIEICALDDGMVTLTRHGLEDVARVIISLTVKGFDINIEEQLFASSDSGCQAASFTLDFMAHERYFVTYSNTRLGLFAAVPFHNRPGINVKKPLS